MSVQNENAVSGGETLAREHSPDNGVYASLFEKINLKPASSLSDISVWQDEAAMADADANERITAGVQIFLQCLMKSGQKVEKLDKTLIDHHTHAADSDGLRRTVITGSTTTRIIRQRTFIVPAMTALFSCTAGNRPVW